MYDSVTAEHIPANAAMVAGYVDGRYRWSAADWARFPGAVKVRVAVFASTNDGDVLDVEPGDATPDQAPGWVLRRLAAGHPRPTIYTLASWASEVRRRLAGAGLRRDQYALWIAHYTGNPAQREGDAEAVQYADPPGSGGHFDLSTVYDPAWPYTGAAPGPTPGNGDDPDQEADMITIEPAAARKALGLPEEVVVAVPPAMAGGARWREVWGSLFVDNFGGPHTDVRVMIKHEAGDPDTNWSPPQGADGDTVHLQSGRSFGWQFAKGDEGVSFVNRGERTVSFLLETAPRA